MNPHSRWLCRCIGTLAAVCILKTSAQSVPVRLRCEYRENPLGVDAPVPHLSWQSDNATRNWRQTAYQIVVTGQENAFSQPDVWDSGKQTGSESVGIAYGGPKLHAGTRYHWRVRVWDREGKPSAWSPPAWWETGLLAKTDWTARWIYRPDPEAEADRTGMQWIWLRDQNALTAPVGAKADSA